MEPNFITEFLTLYQMPAIFLGSVLLGETVVLAASFMAAQGLWSLWTVFWLSLLGTLASDAIWFLYGHKILTYFHRWEKLQGGSEKLMKKLEAVTGERPYLSLLFIKAVYGVRILTIIYLSLRKVSFFTFIIFDAIGSGLWLAILCVFGWMAGRSLVNVEWISNVEYMALVIVLIIVIWRVVLTWLSKRAIKEYEGYNGNSIGI